MTAQQQPHPSSSNPEAAHHRANALTVHTVIHIHAHMALSLTKEGVPHLTFCQEPSDSICTGLCLLHKTHAHAGFCTGSAWAHQKQSACLLMWGLLEERHLLQDPCPQQWCSLLWRNSCTIAIRRGSCAGSLAGLGALGRQSQPPATWCPGACQTAWTSQSSCSAKIATFRYMRAP